MGSSAQTAAENPHFLKTIYKMLPPSSGDILFNGQSLLNMKNKTMARSLAVVAQENGANFDFLVEEVIQMGRYPQKKMLENANDTDKAIVLHSLRMVGMEHVLGRSFLSLSGGEKAADFHRPGPGAADRYDSIGRTDQSP